MRQWFRVAEPIADPAMVAGRPVRNIDPKEGLFVDEEGNSYRLAGGGQAKPDYAEVIPVEGGPLLEAGAAPMSFPIPLTAATAITMVDQKWHRTMGVLLGKEPKLCLADSC